MSNSTPFVIADYLSSSDDVREYAKQSAEDDSLNAANDAFDAFWAKLAPLAAEMLSNGIEPRILAFLAFLEAWQRPHPDEWLLIETAPKDPKVAILGGVENTAGEIFWHDGRECYGHRGEAGWFWESDRDNLLIASNAHVTHWRPMPAGPGVTAIPEE